MTDETREPMADPFQTLPERNFPEDYQQENGMYHNRCIECGFMFIGNKHRAWCKVCEKEPNWQKLSEKKCPPNNSHAHAGCWLEGEMVGFARCMVKKVPQAFEAGKKEGFNEGLAAALEFLRKDQNENYHGWVDGQLEYYKKELEGLKR